MKNRAFSKIKILTFLIILLMSPAALSAQNFNQSLKWNSDPNVLEYHIEVQTSAGKTVLSEITENNFINLSLKEGNYRYRITAYDLLGRESVSTNWINFEIALAKQPEIKKLQNLEALEEDGKTLEMDLNIDDVTADSVAELINTETKAKLAGKLIFDSVAGTGTAVSLSSSETHTAKKVRFTDVPEGKWKLRITNPSGLSSESEAFEVKDVIKEQKLALAKLEEERKERERIEAERKAREEAERLAQEEAQRKAIEEAERLEAERIAKEKAEREEIIRQIQEEKRLEKEREEAERLAVEEAARLEEERIAREEAEALEKEEEKKRRKEAWLNYDRKFYITAGPGDALPLYDNGFFDEYMKKSFANFSITGQIGILPIHTNYIRFGMEINGIYTNFANHNEFYELQMKTLMLQDNLAFRLRLGSKKTWLQAKGGGGIALIQETLDYLNNSENNKQNKTLYFGYFTAGGGLSFMFIPSHMFMMEVGADFYNLFIPDTNIGILNPYIAIGLQF